MNGCVKCGHYNNSQAISCGDCSWPLTLEAWAQTDFKIHRITIDTGCINAKQKEPNINLLEKWSREGKFVLQKSQALLDDLSNASPSNPLLPRWIEKAQNMASHPEVMTFPLTFGDGRVFGGLDMKDALEDVLFPTTANLSENQSRDVEHLRSHVFTGGDVFVTNNSRDFIYQGKQEQLRGFGIWVFLPVEVVNLLQKLYGWV